MNQEQSQRITSYLKKNPTMAIRVGSDWLVHSAAGWEVLFWEELPDFVGDVDAFLAREGKDLNRDDAWVIMKDDGFSTMSDEELVSKMVALGKDPEYVDQIMDGRFHVPKEMAEAIGLDPSIRAN